ncbi:MAG: hypothetical protein QOF44_5489 [Streptomyces sp.]|nr:hypothetical protein [Streptomyces sp.]
MQPLADEDPQQVGPYRLLFRLGEGGMGRVYLGRSPGGRTVAVKMVHAGMASAPGFRERFAREVRASQAVSGAGTVPVVAADPGAPVPWLASAFVAGPSLADAVYEHGPLPQRALWRLLSGLAVALETVHGGGLVHRDLKPSNVLLSLDEPLLIDFGIARAADETALTGTGMVVGSPGYMSPEQAEGREVTAPSDVFSLGAVLAYAAIGRGPFGAGSGPELLYRIVHREPDLTGVPEDFAAVVGECLDKEPGRRPSPEELRNRAEDAVGEGTDGPDWLPAPIASAIARKAEQLLNLEAADGGRTPRTAVVTEADAGRAGGHRPGPAPFFPSAPPTTPRTPPPGPFGRYGPDVAWHKEPLHLRPDPRRRTWVAPWVQRGALGKPLLCLIALVPLTVLLWIGSDLVELRRQHPRAGMDSGIQRLSEWALSDGWRAPLTVLLLLALVVLQVFRGRLQRHPGYVIRLWAAAGAVYWMLVSVTVVLAALWTLGLGWSTDTQVNTGVMTTAGITFYVLAVECLVAPVTLIGGLVRLVSSLTGPVARPAVPDP